MCVNLILATKQKKELKRTLKKKSNGLKGNPIQQISENISNYKVATNVSLDFKDIAFVSKDLQIINYGRWQVIKGTKIKPL